MITRDKLAVYSSLLFLLNFGGKGNLRNSHKNVGNKKIDIELVNKTKKIEDIIENYKNTKTNLTSQDIKKILSKSMFIDTSKVSIRDYLRGPIGGKGSNNSIQGAIKNLEDNLKISSKIGNMRPLDYDTLYVIKTDFKKYGIENVWGVYLSEINSIIIDRSGEKNKENKIINELYRLIAENEKNKFESKIMSNAEKDSTMKEIMKEINRSYANKKLPGRLLKENFSYVVEGLRKYVADKKISYEMAKMAVPHEAFHLLFNKKYHEWNSNGKSVEAFLIAYKNVKDRFKDKRLVYSDAWNNIKTTMERWGNKAPRKVKQAFNEVKPEFLYSSDEWEKLSSRKKKISEFYMDALNLADEYFARVYNGEMGNTPEKARKNIEEVSKKYNVEMPRIVFKRVFHSPSKEDIKYLNGMKYNRKPIIAQGNRLRR